jgi:hypothetical protein
MSTRSRNERAAGRDDPHAVMVGHAAVFDEWTKIHSVFEGRFMERLAPGAFKDSISDDHRIVTLYDHGHDPSVGNKPLGRVSQLREDGRGLWFEVELFNADYVDDSTRSAQGLTGNGPYSRRVRPLIWRSGDRAAGNSFRGTATSTWTNRVLCPLTRVTW